MAEREMELPRGFVLSGRYEVLQKLGEGSFSSVYRVYDRSLDTECAVKILHRWAGADRKLVERFKREVLYSRRVVHQGCCQVFDFHESENVAMLVMELVPGWTCNDLLIKRGPLPLDAATSLVAQAAASIAVLHRNEIVHRDIKAENLMITPQGRVKVLDLGMSWSAELSSLTAAGAVLGTPAYMAPEFIQGGSPTPRSDVYSFGVLSYYVLAGQLPFQAVELARLLALQIKEEPGSLRRYRADLPKVIDELVLRCLRKDPGARPKDMVELESAWISILGGSPDPEPLQAVVRPLGMPLAAEPVKAKTGQPPAAEPKVAKGRPAEFAQSPAATVGPAAAARAASATQSRGSKPAPDGQASAGKPATAARTPVTKPSPGASATGTKPPKVDAPAAPVSAGSTATSKALETEGAESGEEPAYDSFTDLIIGALGPSRGKTETPPVSPKAKEPAVPAGWTKPKPAPRGTDTKRVAQASAPDDPEDSASLMTQVLRIGPKQPTPPAKAAGDPHQVSVKSKPEPPSTIPDDAFERTEVLSAPPRAGQSLRPTDSPGADEVSDSGTLQVSIPSLKPPPAPPSRQQAAGPSLAADSLEAVDVSDSGTLQVSIPSVKSPAPPSRQQAAEPTSEASSPESWEISDRTLQVNIPAVPPPAAPPRQTASQTPARRVPPEPAPPASRKTSAPSASPSPPPPSPQIPPASPQQARAASPPRQPVPKPPALEEVPAPFEPPSPDSGPTGIAAAMDAEVREEDSAEVTAIRTSPIELRKRSNRLRALVALLIVMILVTTGVGALLLLRTPQGKSWLDTLQAIVRLLKG